MADITWAPYFNKMKEQLAQLPLSKQSEWKGADSILETFGTEKIEKISVGIITVGESRYGLCAIFPAAGYDLPIFFSRWEETKSEIVFLVDLMPTVETLVDEPYRKKYIESLDPLWQRYEALPGVCPEEHDGLRSICSIIYTAARIPIEKEGMRLAALAPHTEYLKQYMEFIRSAAPIDDAAQLKETTRKIAAVKKMLRSYFTGVLAGKVGEALRSDRELFMNIFM